MTTVNKGHGRLETRHLTCTDDLDDYLRWPGVQQVLRRRVRAGDAENGRGDAGGELCADEPGGEAATPDDLAALWRGHWTIENRRHYVRDVTLGEDACQMRTGQARRRWPPCATP